MKKSHVVYIHLAFWTMFVVVPMLIFRIDDFHREGEIRHFLEQTIINVLVFYLTYWVLIPRMMKRKKPVELVFIALGWIVLLATIRTSLLYYYREVLTPLEGRPYRFDRQIFRDLFGTIMFTLYSILLYFSIEWFKERQYRFELAREKQKSEIDLLKSQMNPHFLMNTLNNLYSLVYQGSSKASDAVLKLSDIMRYMLYDTKADKVPLENEIKYLRSFIELQMLRFKNQELVKFDTSGDVSGRMVAPMLFIPFVENAFKHGNKNLPGMGISILLKVETGKLIFEVDNLKVQGEIQKDKESGIGLENVQKRLGIQYPEKHVLKIEQGKERFHVYLEIID